MPRSLAERVGQILSRWRKFFEGLEDRMKTPPGSSRLSDHFVFISGAVSHTKAALTMENCGSEDYTKYYDLESYLFGEVRARFQAEKMISAFDFFCIMIWKANRAKSRIATHLLKQGLKRRSRGLEAAVKALVQEICSKSNAKDRLKVLVVDWGFKLPTASAILTVLYPEEFTVYDRRVCEQLKRFADVHNKSNLDEICSGYWEYKKAVVEKVPGIGNLREKDRYLWGKSLSDQLDEDIKRWDKPAAQNADSLQITPSLEAPPSMKKLKT
jgi:hypothetical protein